MLFSLSNTLCFVSLQQALQSAAQLFGFPLTDRENHLAGGTFVGLADDARLHVLDNAHDVVHLRIGKGVGDATTNAIN